MGKYDVYDRQFLGDLTRMADLISVCVFRGRVRVNAEELKRLERTYPSLKSQSGEAERDILCLCERHRVKYGLELETQHDYSTPKRMLVYDSGEYEKECDGLRKEHELNKEFTSFAERKSGLKESDKIYTVINMVLYLGEGHFKGKRSLRELMHDIPMEYKPYIHEKQQNYTYLLLEADYVKPEEFTGDLRLFFTAMQVRNQKAGIIKLFEQEEFQSAGREVQKAIALHLGQKKLIKKVVEEEMTMCKALRDLEKDWKNVGRQEGRQEGRLQDIKSVMQTLKLSAMQAMDVLMIEEESREGYLELL